MFFNGTLNDDGSCVIEIPRLKNVDEKKGKLTVEAIADSIYFKVYEAEVELKNSVEVTMQTPTVKKAKPATSVELEGFSQEPKVEPKKQEMPTIFEKKDEKEPESDGWERVPWTQKYKSNPKEEQEEKTKTSSKFRSFQEYVKKQKN